MNHFDRFETKEITNSDAWDRYVLDQEQSGYCHLFNWSKVIEDAYLHKPLYLAAIKKSLKNRNKICGILPLFNFYSFTGRSKLISIPFFDSAGILARDMEARSFLFKTASSFPGQAVSSAMELRQDRPLIIPDMELSGVMPENYTAKKNLYLKITGSQEKIMAGFKSKLRSQIRKGQKNGLTWKIGKTELLDPFYQVFSRNMRDLGSPVHSKKFFSSIFKYFYDHSFICVVFFKSQPVAASFMFRFKNRLANPWASSIREYRHLNSNMFLYWQMIRFACNIGMDTFDMGRSSKGAPTYNFKKQWGPSENQIFWYSWFFRGKPINMPGETLVIEAWKKLPLGIANLMGPFLRRYISL
jgi:FemAB-related protein (PEP-CTERM system-associated)